MFPYFLLLIAVLLILVLVLGYAAKADPKKLASALRMIGGIALMGLAVALVARGLMVYAVPLAIAGYALMQGRSPFPSPFSRRSRKSPGQQSQVRTPYLEMRLDHDSGDMEGMVLKGRFARRMLSEMRLEELIELLGECRRADNQGAQLLEAFIDHTYPDWRDLAGEAGSEGSPAEESPETGPMSVEEAYDILGLAPGAGRDDIRKAHRTLMKKLHPDQGGSNYLAAKINEAKDLLLQQRRDCA